MEEWKDITITNGKYQVSNHGNVKILFRYHFCGFNKSIQHVKYTEGKLLKKVIGNRGYINYRLYVDGCKIDKQGHRLVAEAFIENPDNKLEVNHIDSNKQNNHITNLEWVTRQENQIHYANSPYVKHPIGEKVGTAKLTESDIIAIRKDNRTLKEIALSYNCNFTNIGYIKNYKTWKHIKP